ncbi:Restriction modification enzyme [Canicola haemoglobinophilus]|uniref:Restriction modification enzyme n=2 Tax=Canicola haemoglobinophilus TaxID=733 RepID=A0AB38HBV6_9PAST|nr:Restriction modification enzyme [Canicola haemoglobinophilus]STO91804.1 Restriction modification enzyme [Canicola haemoglobinophilus]
MEYAKFITTDSLDKYADIRFLKNKDLLWNSTGLGTLGRIAIYFEKLNSYELSVVDSHVTVVRLLKVVPEYIYYYLSSYYVQSVIEDKADGSTKQKELSLATISGYLLPLPPLSEQKRIVAKIEELLPFIEQYAKKEQELTALHQAFPEQLKKSILQAAIQGKLTEQNPNDEPAVELIKRIQVEKERLILEKKIKKPKQHSEIIVRDNSHYEIVDGVERCIDDEIPFEIPESWCWVRLKDITYQLGQEIPKSTFCYIDVGLIDNKLHRISNNQNIIEPNDAPSRARKIVQKGTILYSTVRPYLKNICILEEDFPYTPIASTAFATMETFQDIDRKFLFYYLLSPTFTDFVNQAMVGVAYPAINDENLYKIVVPIPPLEEQQRIVSKIEQLFSYLENLTK